MTANTTILSTPADTNWPSFAPSWARRASIEPDGEVTFERAWEIPGQYRDMTPLPIVRVDQRWAADERAEYAPVESPRVVASSADLWSDHRARLIAATLRDIANALDPVPLGGAA